MGSSSLLRYIYSFVTFSCFGSSSFFSPSKFFKSSFFGHLYFSGCFLKLPIFVVQKATAPKNGVEFCQGFNVTIRSSLATSCDVAMLGEGCSCCCCYSCCCSCCDMGKQSQLLLRPTKVGSGLQVQSGV